MDETFPWRNHIQVPENKISEKIELSFRVSHFLEFKSLQKIIQ